MNLSFWRRHLFLRRATIDPSEVRLGNYILCSDGKTREVDVLGYERRGEGVYRFMFSDDTWIQYDPGQKATVVR